LDKKKSRRESLTHLVGEKSGTGDGNEKKNMEGGEL